MAFEWNKLPRMRKVFRQQRRQILKWGGALALGSLGASFAVNCDAAVSSSAMVTLVDVDLCDGCGACVSACRERSGRFVPSPPSAASEGDAPSRERPFSRSSVDRLTPYNWLYVQSCVIRDRQGERRVFLPRRCMQCGNPSCVSFCPTGAARHRSSGAVYIDHTFCLGDGRCMYACPWGIPRFQAGMRLSSFLGPMGKGLMFKCDYCQDLLARGAPPACVSACSTGAQRIGPRDIMVRRARELADARGGEIFGLAENGGTNTLYVSSLPFQDLDAALLRQDQIGPGRPSLRQAHDSLAKGNDLLRNILLAPLLGIVLGGMRLWRERQMEREP